MDAESAPFFQSIHRRVLAQLELSPEEASIMAAAAESAQSSFLYIHLRRKDKYPLSAWNVDQATLYTILLGQAVHLRSPALAEKIYYFMRTSFAIDVFPSRKLPALFSLVHPIGTILGNATYGEGLVVYQRVTVGGSPRLEYPVIGEGVILYAGAAVIGAARIGKNCIVGAGVQVGAEEIPDNTIIYLDAGTRKTKTNQFDNMQRFFK